jgi:hypothetical protein
MGPISDHITTESHPSEYSTTPTVQSSSEHAVHIHLQEHDHYHVHSTDKNVAVTTLIYPTEQETVSGPHDVQDYDLSSQTENETRQSHTAEVGSSEKTVNHHSYHPEVPASVHMIYDDDDGGGAPNTERSYHTAGKDEDLGSTVSPHLHTETQTFTVNVINEHPVTEYSDDMIIRHRDNESNGTTVSERQKVSASWLNMFTPHEIHTEAEIVTTVFSVTSELQEHHTTTSEGIFGEDTENEARPMEKKRGFTHSIHENRSEDFNSSASKKSDTADTSETAAAEPASIRHSSHSENETATNSSKVQAADIPVRIVDAENEEHDQMLTSVYMKNDTKIMPDSSDKMKSVPLTQLAGREMHKHGSDLFNDVYFPDSEHAENDTALNALSPEDYENHAVKPVNVVSKPNPNLKKGARLDDDEMFQMNPNEHDHTATSEPNAESVPVIIHSSESASKSSAAPVTNPFYSQVGIPENNKTLSVSREITGPHFIPVTEVTELGNATVGNVEHLDEAKSKRGDADGHDMLENITEPAVAEIMLKPDKQNLSAVVKGTDKQVDKEGILTESVSEGTFEDTVTGPVTSTDASTAELSEFYSMETTTVIQADHVASDIMMKDVEMTTVPTFESANTHNAKPTLSFHVNGSNNSGEGKNSSALGDNTIEDGQLLHTGFFSTTTELEVDHSFTVAPLSEHHDNETMPKNKVTMVESVPPIDVTTQTESVGVTSKNLLLDEEHSTAAPSDSVPTQSVVHMLAAKISPTLPHELSDYMTTVVPHEENDISSSADANDDKRKTDTGIFETPQDKQQGVTKSEDRALSNTIANVTQSVDTNSTPHKGAATTTDSTDKTEKDDVNSVNVSEKVSSAFGVSSDTAEALSAVPDTAEASSAVPDPTGSSSAAPDTAGASSAAPETRGPSTDASDSVGVSSVTPDTSDISSASPDIMLNYEEVQVTKTDTQNTANGAKEMASDSKKEVQDADALGPKAVQEHVNTVKPLLQNVSSTHNNQEPILLGLGNNTDAKSHGSLDTRITEHNNSDFEKPHEFTDIENKLLVDSGKIHDVAMSSTTEYANEIHALPPSGGGNVIPPTAQSTLLVDPITDEIQIPTLVGQVKKETIPVNITEGLSAVEQTEKGENLTNLKVDKETPAVPVSKPEPKKKDFLNVSINKKPLKFTGDTSSLQGENDQLPSDKSTISLYEKKPVDKLQKFDKDSSKKIDKIGFSALPVGDNSFDEQDDLLEDTDVITPAKETSANTTVTVFQGANSTTEVSSLVDEEARPVDEDDENEDLLTSLRKDIGRVNIVEPQGMVMKDKTSDRGGNKDHKFEGEMIKNESIAMADNQHVLARNVTDKATDEVKIHTESSIAVGIEPAIGLGGNETSALTDSVLTTRMPLAAASVVPRVTMNEPVSPSAAPGDEKLIMTKSPTDEPSLKFYNQTTVQKALDKNVTGNTSTAETDSLVPVTSDSSYVLSDTARNTSLLNPNVAIVMSTIQEDGSSSATASAPPLVLPTNITLLESSEVPANTVVTLNNKDFARLHKGSVSLEYGGTQSSTKEFNTTTDAFQPGGSNGATRNWIFETNTTASRSAILEPPTTFSKCASGWLLSLH